MNRIPLLTLLCAPAFVLAAQVVYAHFIWLVPQPASGETTIQAYFGEDASPDDPAFLKYALGMKAWAVSENSQATPVEFKLAEESLTATIGQLDSKGPLLVATHDLGVSNRGGGTFRLKYYAKSGPSAGAVAWKNIDTGKWLRLDIVPATTDQGVTLNVLFDGKAIEGSDIVASGPDLFDFEGKTGESGTVDLPITKPGLYSIRAKHVEAVSGELDGQEYPETRHYTTLTLRIESKLSGAAAGSFQPLAQPVTSFGGAILGDNVYLYGGHTGSAHSYSREEQDNTLKRLSLETGKWEEISQGPHLQGLALVPYGERLYRIGGFTAKNAEGEEGDLWSQDSVAAFDLASKEWIDLPALPEPRSSFDAAVLDGTIYVIGGWKMAGGDSENVWHKSAWAMDLDSSSPAWTELPQPPFVRRALAVAAHQGKVYAIGGMQEDGGPTVRVDYYDPATREWSRGPDLVVDEQPAGEGNQSRGSFSGGMTGFGAAAFATGGRLFVSTFKGNLQRLSADGTQWEIIGQTPTPRFFHRMLPVNDHQLLVVGGASMEIGKFDEVEILSVENE